MGCIKTKIQGCPIPIAYDENNNAHPIPKTNLPVELPENIDINVKGNPLDNQKDWKKITLNGKNYREKLIL